MSPRSTSSTTRRTASADTRRTPRAARAGLFVTFEGIEGSGKSSQCRTLAQWLRTQGYTVLETREPGGTKVAELLRGALLERRQEPITPWAEALIVLAARSQHVEHVIAPALRRGTIVLCDRYADSTIAYQGYGRGLDKPLLTSLHRVSAHGLTPDLTFVLDLPVEMGLQRRHHNQLEINRIDAEAISFHAKVRRGFRTLARQHPRRIRLIDGRRAPEPITLDLQEALVHAMVGRRLAQQAPDSTATTTSTERRT
ncbi:MAG: dTMP kinase [Nitrospiraceae bacterium]